MTAVNIVIERDESATDPGKAYRVLRIRENAPRSLHGYAATREEAEALAEQTRNAFKKSRTSRACRCNGDSDNHGRCYQCGGYTRSLDAGRYF